MICFFRLEIKFDSPNDSVLRNSSNSFLLILYPIIFSPPTSISSSNSFLLPKIILPPLSLSDHMGNGVPQNRERDKFQSCKFSSQLPKRPSPVDFGFQLIVLFSSINFSLAAVVWINHERSG